MVQSAIIDWDADGAPRSRQFDDIYFSRQDGLAEARAVYLQGCGLPEAFQGRDRFVLAELGFGTGLNVLALLELWARTRTPQARLHVFSIEAFPAPADAARKALEAWPELGALAERLLARWPTAPGFHRIDFPDLNAVLDVAVMEAAEALGAWDGRADAWFLDGFSPAKNPEMWREEVLALVAARSAPGARIATFSVAGAVRRGLEAQGFSVARRPGFGAKGQRLEAIFDRAAGAPEARAPGRVCIIGAGVSGAALARAFLALGVSPAVVELQAVGAGASGNPAALVTPRLDAGGGPPARLHAQAFERAVDLYLREPGAVISRGALQLEAADRDASRFDRVARSELFEPGALVRLSPDEAAERLGEPANAGGLWIRDGLTIEPAPVLRAWLEDARMIRAEVLRLERLQGVWRLIGPDGEVILEADAVCLAAGADSPSLHPDLPLSPVRGQASFLRDEERPAAAAWGGYVIPTRQGLLFGATHVRGDNGHDVRAADNEHNLGVLARARPELALRISGKELGARAAVRAATPDFLPLAGPIPGQEGLYILGGLGGRGFALAPLLAEHVCALVAGVPSPLPAPLARAVHPDRFSVRSASHGQPWRKQVPA